jgi:hypothetical protein
MGYQAEFVQVERQSGWGTRRKSPEVLRQQNDSIRGDQGVGIAGSLGRSRVVRDGDAVQGGWYRLSCLDLVEALRNREREDPKMHGVRASRGATRPPGQTARPRPPA